MEFKPGDEVIYQQAHEGADMEFGVVKRVNNTNDGYFVWYHMGDTAANTPTDLLRRVGNSDLSNVINAYAVETLKERARLLREEGEERV